MPLEIIRNDIAKRFDERARERHDRRLQSDAGQAAEAAGRGGDHHRAVR